MKLIEYGKKGVAWLYLLIVSVILFDLLVVQNFVENNFKRHFSHSNAVLLLFGVLAVLLTLAAAIIAYRYLGRRLDRIVCKKTVALCAILLFVLQFYISYNIFFLTDWDVKLVLQMVEKVAANEPVDAWYYSRYPNNLAITFLYVLIFKLHAAVGIFESGVIAIIALQCALSAVASYLVYTVLFDIVKNRWIAFLGFWIYVLFIGFSPWFVIPYSDGTGFLFPILIFRLYQLAKRNPMRWKRLLYWGLIGAATFIGYKIKPQIAIVFIAILIAGVVELVLKPIENKKEFFKRSLGLLLCLAVFGASNLAFGYFSEKQTKIVVNDERTFGLPHFFMMGLNDETDGGYLESDIGFSDSFETKEERDRGNVRIAIERITKYGVGGICRHLTEKLLVIYGDGTFAWCKEGEVFFDEMMPEPNHGTAPFLRSYYYSWGTHFQDFMDSMQAIWLVLLFLGALSVLYVLKKGNGDLAVILLALLGLAAFELLFEARARYLFTYAPFYIICAAVGFYVLFDFTKKLIKKIQDKKEKKHEANVVHCDSVL